jgi:hypothetical protein
MLSEVKVGQIRRYRDSLYIITEAPSEGYFLTLWFNSLRTSRFPMHSLEGDEVVADVG